METFKSLKVSELKESLKNVNSVIRKDIIPYSKLKKTELIYHLFSYIKHILDKAIELEDLQHGIGFWIQRILYGYSHPNEKGTIKYNKDDYIPKLYNEMTRYGISKKIFNLFLSEYDNKLFKAIEFNNSN